LRSPGYASSRLTLFGPGSAQTRVLDRPVRINGDMVGRGTLRNEKIVAHQTLFPASRYVRRRASATPSPLIRSHSPDGIGVGTRELLLQGN
jgi:hypothetical protein